MKKLPLILSVISILAVVIFLLWQLTRPDSDAATEVQASEERAPSGNIAYVEIDSIILNFDMYFNLREDLMAKQQSSESELNTRGRQYETGARDYEEKVRKGLVTRATAAQMEQELLQQQQELINLRDQLESQLIEEEQVMNRKILNYIYDYLEEFSADHNYDFILAKSFGNPVMYADSALDITDAVLKGVNFKYNKDTGNK